jgi:hypothetical protein
VLQQKIQKYKHKEIPYRNKLWPVVLHGYETWSLPLRKERRLRVLESKVLRKIFGSKRSEVTGEWRKLYNEERNNLYSSSNAVKVIISRRMRWAGHVPNMGDSRGVYKILVGKPVGKRPLGRSRRKCVDNIKMGLQEVGWGEWTGLIWLRIGQMVWLCECGNEPSGSIKCGEVLDWLRTD